MALHASQRAGEDRDDVKVMTEVVHGSLAQAAISLNLCQIMEVCNQASGSEVVDECQDNVPNCDIL